MLEHLTTAQRAIVSISKFETTPAGVALHMCTTEEFYAAFPSLMCRDSDWGPASAALLQWAKSYLGGSGATPNVAPAPTPTRGEFPAKKPEKPPATGVEARILELKGTELVRVCTLNKLQVEPHPSNPGITAMRRKNALLTLHRRGSPVKL